jgi:hypothetical protein
MATAIPSPTTAPVGRLLLAHRRAVAAQRAAVPSPRTAAGTAPTGVSCRVPLACRTTHRATTTAPVGRLPLAHRRAVAAQRAAVPSPRTAAGAAPTGASRRVPLACRTTPRATTTAPVGRLLLAYRPCTAGRRRPLAAGHGTAPVPSDRAAVGAASTTAGRRVLLAGGRPTPLGI